MAALLAAAAGLVVSIRVNGPGALIGTPAGRWIVERVAPASLPADVIPANDGDLVGPLELTDLDGKFAQLPATGRHRVLINVWASWCGPCRDEMSLLTALAGEQGANRVQLVGIAEDEAAAVRRYLRQTPVNYPIFLDDPNSHAGARLGNRLGVLPYSVLIDGDGRLLRRKYGPFADAKALADWVSVEPNAAE